MRYRNPIEPLLLALLFLLCLAAKAVAQQDQGIRFVSEAMVTGDYEDVEVVGDRLYCANRYGVVIYDLADWDPAAPPVELARFPTRFTAYGLFLEDTLCYVADGNGGLAIYDISDLCAVRELGRYSGARPATAVTVRDGIAYVIAHRMGFHSIDVSNPRNPTQLGVIDVISEHRTIILRDTLLWIAARTEFALDYLTAVDVSDPAEMEVVGRFTGKWTSNFSLNDDNTAAFIGVNNFYSVDIRNPAQMSLLDSSRGGGEIGISGGALFRDGLVYGSYNGISIVDVSNPSDVVYLGGISYWAIGQQSGGDRALTLYDATLFAGAKERGLQIMEVGNPRNPRLLHINNNTGRPEDVIIRGDYMFVGDRLTSHYNRGQNDWEDCHLGRFRVFSIADINRPVQVAELDSFYKPEGYGDSRVRIALRDSLLYLGRGKLFIHSVSNPESPVLINSRARAPYGYQMVFHNEYLIESDRYGLYFYSFADPVNPTRIIYYPREGNNFNRSLGVIPTDDLLYVPTRINEGPTELWIWDWSDLERVHRVGEACRLPRDLEWGLKRGDYLYWVAGDYDFLGLCVVSVEDPLRPSVVYYSEDVRHGRDIKLFDDKLFIADGEDGVKVFSLADPANPEQIGSYDTPGKAMRLDVDPERGFMAVADWTDVSLYDVGVLLGVWNLTLEETSHDYGVVTVDSMAVWDLIIVNQSEREIVIDSLAVSGEGFLVDRWENTGIATGGSGAFPVMFRPDTSAEYFGEVVVYSAERTLMASLSGRGEPLSAAGFADIPTEFALLPPHPNPFNGITIVEYTLPVESAVSLSIYDLTGREIVTLIQGRQRAGYYRALWDGNNASGVAVGSGMFFVRMETPKVTKVTKMTLVK